MVVNAFGWESGLRWILIEIEAGSRSFQGSQECDFGFEQDLLRQEVGWSAHGDASPQFNLPAPAVMVELGNLRECAVEADGSAAGVRDILKEKREALIRSGGDGVAGADDGLEPFGKKRPPALGFGDWRGRRIEAAGGDEGDAESRLAASGAGKTML